MALQYFHSSPYKCHWFRHQEIFRAVLSTAAKWTALLPLLPACCTIIPLSVTYSLHVSSLPRAWNAWKGCTPLTQTFQSPSSSRDRSSPARLKLGLGLCQKPTRNIPLSSLRWAGGEQASTFTAFFQCGGKKHSHVPRYHIKYKWHEGFCHVAELLREERLNKDNEWLKWQGKKKSMISQRKK